VVYPILPHGEEADEDADEEMGRFYDGWLPLHGMVGRHGYRLREASTVSPLADAFRLLLRLYPEAVSVELGGDQHKFNSFQQASDLPIYHRRLLLRAAPNLDPAELRRLNWEERRIAMFLAYTALSATPPLLARLRYENKDLVKLVVSFL
jgi:hypothetical protein